LLTSKKQSSVLSSTLPLYYLWSIGKARSTMEAGISFTFQWFDVHWHSDLKIPSSNLVVNKQFYLQETHTLEAFLCLTSLPVTCTKYNFVG
jgi:hypothetical protein